jgi:lipopolysaccharide transport system ATP-binding protein
MNAVIQAVGLAKQYKRGIVEDPGLRHALDRFVRSPLSVFRRQNAETFWALKDVSLEVKEGEVLGLIGRNGAGKTTLLKILSRITRPTAGWAEIHGRVGTLLEVGTGFHPELTGRENTFLSGAILGMGKAEIARKFDEIVAFAELEKFIDTAVKHYSSGMYVRLAFAVAAHLEPEILLVDEVLAVGDINFQKKCLGKMGDVAKAGRTVVLVTHQQNQIRRLCHRVVWVDRGEIRKDGPVHEVVAAYETAMARGENHNGHGPERILTKGRFVKWEIIEPQGNNPHMLTEIGPTTVAFTVEVREAIHHGQQGVALFNHDRQLVWASAAENVQLEPGSHQFQYTFPMLPLRPGPYSWNVTLYEEGTELDVWECMPEMVVATRTHQHQDDRWNGFLNMPSEINIVSRGQQ